MKKWLRRKALNLLERWEIYHIEEFQAGGHCGCCGKWVKSDVVPEVWPWTLCDQCTGQKPKVQEFHGERLRTALTALMTREGRDQLRGILEQRRQFELQHLVQKMVNEGERCPPNVEALWVYDDDESDFGLKRRA